MVGLYRKATALSPEPWRIARSLQAKPGAFWLDSPSPYRRAILGAYPSHFVNGWDPEPTLLPLPNRPELSHIPRWLGVVPYEACREQELASRAPDPRIPSSFGAVQWRRYGAVVVVAGGKVEVIGDDAHAVDALFHAVHEPPKPFSATLAGFLPQEPDQRHLDSIREILRHIAAGSLYQVNLARAFRGIVEGSAFALYAQAFGRALVPFGFAVDWGTGHRIVGASPELCLEHRANGSLLTRPIKGTRPRGASSAEDEALARELATDPKERAELNMVVDLERNDLGRLSETGSVEVLSAGEVESYETVHHRVATIRSRVRRDVTREQLLRTFLPSGSVTGTPKLAAMRQIAHLEPERRGLYTGAIGYIAQDGGLRLAMAIRTMTVDRDGQAQYFAGGGIVADSQPEREVMETLWKTRQLCAGLVEGTTAPRGLAVDRSSEQTSVENWADWLSSSTDEGDSISGAAD